MFMGNYPLFLIICSCLLTASAGFLRSSARCCHNVLAAAAAAGLVMQPDPGGRGPITDVLKSVADNVAATIAALNQCYLPRSGSKHTLAAPRR